HLGGQVYSRARGTDQGGDLLRIHSAAAATGIPALPGGSVAAFARSAGQSRRSPAQRDSSRRAFAAVELTKASVTMAWVKSVASHGGHRPEPDTVACQASRAGGGR